MTLRVTILTGIVCCSCSIFGQNVGVNTDGSNPVSMLHVKTLATAGSDGLLIENPNGGNGDAILTFRNNGNTDEWTLGFDDSDADDFKISQSATLGTTNALTIDGGTRQILAGTDGTNGDPVWSFESDDNTGLYQSANDNLSISAGGTETMRSNQTVTSFMDEIRTRATNANAGDILVRLYDSGGDDGVIDVYENNAYNHRIHGNGTTIFNEQGLSLDYRIETPNRANMFMIDASNDQIIVNRATQHLGYTDPFSVYVTDNATIPFAITGWNQGTTGGAATFYTTSAANGYNTLESSSDGSSSAGWFLQGSGTNNSIALLVTNTAGNNRFGVYDEDNSVALGYFTISDERLKRNINSINSGLSEVNKLNPVTYYMDNDTYPSFGNSNDLQYGFLAQEVGGIFPSLVAENSIMDPNQIPREGRSDWSDVETPFSAVNYQGLIPVLTKALQEEDRKVEELTKRIEELEKLVQDLTK